MTAPRERERVPGPAPRAWSPVRRRRRWSGLAAAGPLLLTVLALAGCVAGPGGPTGGPTSVPDDLPDDLPDGEVEGDVVVFAAASLTGAFTRIGTDFERAHPGASVTFSFGASSALARQVVAGAPAGVFASAAPAPMSVVTEDGSAVGEPRLLARNRLEIAVPTGNPGEVTGLADLADPERTIALCAEQVPCGAAAAVVFAAADLAPAPDTLEQDVKAVLSKVALGEVDAGLVYRTDVLAATDRVQGIAFPEADDAVNDLSLVALEGAAEPEVARAFVQHVLSAEGRRVLADAGFDAP